MTPVERVARAIAGYMHPDRTEDYWHNWLEEVQREHFRVQARAAIEVLREPSDAMVEAGAHVEDGGGDFWIGTDAANACWHAMVTAALGEGGE